MAAITASTAPAARDRWRVLRKLGNVGGAVARATLTPHKASLSRLADMPLSVIGTGGIDFAAFHVDHGVGWLVLGASLWIIEHLIADDSSSERE